MSTEPQRSGRTWIVRSPADLGRAISGLRRVTGRNQQQLAEEGGLGRDLLSELENGAGPMVIGRVLRILRLMGATVTITLPRESGGGERDGGE